MGSQATRPGDAPSQEQRELAREAAQLREQVAAFQSSRWWRLHPRFLLRRLRGDAPSEPGKAVPDRGAEPLPDDFAESDAELWRRVAPYTMTTPGKVHALARAVEYVTARAIPGAFVEC